MQILKWRDIGRDGQGFHAARDTLTSLVALHGHDFAEVFWVDAGRGVHRVNDLVRPLETGDLVMIRPRDCHSIQPDKGQTLELTNVAFSRETLGFLRERYFADKDWAFWESGRHPYAVRLDRSQLQVFNHRADRLAAAPPEAIHMERFLINLLADLRSAPSRDLPADTPDWLAHACAEIERPEYFSQGASGFTRAAGRGREHVARSVRQYFGTSPTEYVNKVRMRHAARQLVMSRQSILDIALECGIENLSHFYRLFRGEHGMTPRRYRLLHHRPIS